MPGFFYEEGDGFLLLLRQRAGYRLLNFYLHPGAKLCLPEQPSPLVTELACREKDQDAMRRAQDALCALGFAQHAVVDDHVAKQIGEHRNGAENAHREIPPFG